MNTQPMTNYDEQIQSLVRQASDFAITDQKSYDAAGALKRDVIVPLKKEIADTFGPIKEKTHTAWKEAVAQEKRHLDPVIQAEQAVNGLRGQFEEEQERIRMREQARVDEENRKAGEQRQLDEAVAVEQAGGSKREVDAVLKAPPQVQRTVVQPSFQKTEGVRTGAVRWSAQLDSKFALIKHVAKNPALMHLLEANMPGLNAMARSQRERMDIPGVRAVSIRS